MHMAMPTKRSGMPTNKHQKYLGGSNVPKEEKKLPTPITINSTPNPAIVGPRIRKTSLVVECVGSIFDSSLMELPPFWRRSSVMLRKLTVQELAQQLGRRSS